MSIAGGSRVRAGGIYSTLDVRVRVLTGDDVRQLVEPATAVDAVEHVFVAHGRGETVMPAKVYLPLERYRGDFRAMPAYFDGMAGVKWVNAHPYNPADKGLPAVLAVMVLNDPSSGVPLALLDATWLTALRTGAAAAVATKHLARAGARSLGIVGCGAQARTTLACHRITMRIERVVLFDAVREAAEQLAAENSDLSPRVGTLEEAAGCDVVCTLTPSRAPLIAAALVHPGTHVNAMGADAPGKQELDPAIVKAARVFVDDWEQACESGEVNVPLRTGLLTRDEIAASVGEVLAGAAPGRLSDDDITIFDSTGLAVQDIAVARVAFERARSAGQGAEIDLMRP